MSINDMFAKITYAPPNSVRVTRCVLYYARKMHPGGSCKLSDETLFYLRPFSETLRSRKPPFLSGLQAIKECRSCVAATDEDFGM